MSLGLGDLFGKDSIAQQFLIWQVLGQLIQPYLNPIVQTIASDMWQTDPNVPIPAELCAGLVNRGLMSVEKGISESSKSGLGEPQFRAMLAGAGQPPTLIEAIELLRRSEIPLGELGQDGMTFYGALKDAGIRDDWAAQLAKLKVNKPSAAEALNALLQGQIDHDLAYRLYLQAGGDPDWFQHAFDSEGTGPTPDMAGIMANRGIIPWDGEGPGVTSFRQAFLEGPLRNKWEPSMREMMVYRIPPRSVTAMLHAGALTDAEALQRYRDYGMSAADAAAMLKEAHHTAVAAAKTLSAGQVGQLYHDGKITRDKAQTLLMQLGYTATNADLLLSLQDVAKADTHLTAAIGRVHALFTAHKITADAARKSLTDLKVSGPQAAELMTLWELEASINVRQLTPAQIVAAWDAKVLSQAEATTELMHLNYTEFDAWVLLSIHLKEPAPHRPAAGTGPGVNP